MLEPAVLDCAFDFREISCNKLSDTDTEVIEQYDQLPYVHKLSSLILLYLQKMCCWDQNDMYYRKNIVVEKAFDIVDTVRQKCGGERFYLLPYNITDTASKMVELQFGTVKRIVDGYKNTQRKDKQLILVSHE